MSQKNTSLIAQAAPLPKQPSLKLVKWTPIMVAIAERNTDAIRAMRESPLLWSAVQNVTGPVTEDSYFKLLTAEVAVGACGSDEEREALVAQGATFRADKPVRDWPAVRHNAPEGSLCWSAPVLAAATGNNEALRWHLSRQPITGEEALLAMDVAFDTIVKMIPVHAERTGSETVAIGEAMRSTADTVRTLRQHGLNSWMPPESARKAIDDGRRVSGPALATALNGTSMMRALAPLVRTWTAPLFLAARDYERQLYTDALVLLADVLEAEPIPKGLEDVWQRVNITEAGGYMPECDIGTDGFFDGKTPLELILHATYVTEDWKTLMRINPPNPKTHLGIIAAAACARKMMGTLADHKNEEIGAWALQFAVECEHNARLLAEKGVAGDTRADIGAFQSLQGALSTSPGQATNTARRRLK